MNGHFSDPSRGDRSDGGKQVIRRARQCKDRAGASRSPGWSRGMNRNDPVYLSFPTPAHPSASPPRPPPKLPLVTTQAICYSWIFISVDFPSSFASFSSRSFLPLLFRLSSTSSPLPSLIPPDKTISESRPQRLLRGRLETGPTPSSPWEF